VGQQQSAHLQLKLPSELVGSQNAPRARVVPFKANNSPRVADSANRVGR
jgi:hypothetical protein